MYGIHRRRNDDQIHLNLSKTHRRIILLHCNTAANILSKDRSQEQFPNGCISQNASKPISSLFQCCHVFFFFLTARCQTVTSDSHRWSLFTPESQTSPFFYCFYSVFSVVETKRWPKENQKQFHIVLFFKFTFFNHSKHFSLCQKTPAQTSRPRWHDKLIRASISLNMHSPIWGSQRMTTSWEKDKYI